MKSIFTVCGQENVTLSLLSDMQKTACIAVQLISSECSSLDLGTIQPS